MKIVYCTDSICYPGGIQNITITKANGLAQMGHQVWIIVTDNKYPPLHPVDPKVQVINLDINYFEDDWKSKFYVIKSILIKRKKHKKAIAKVLNDINPDIIISTGTSEKNFLPNIRLNSTHIFIREIHNQKGYRLSHARSLFEKIMAIIGNWYDYSWNINKYDQIVILTNEDKELNWKNNSKVSVINNPVTFDTNIKTAPLTNKKIITAGRLVYQKNHKSLINAWKIVNQKHPDWQLEIWGEGSLRESLQRQIDALHLSSVVHLKGVSPSIGEVYSHSSFFVMSSLYEGFPLVLVEAMNCGLPCVSFDITGANSIIDNGKNGFLVPDNDVNALAEACIKLIENKVLLEDMGKQAYMSGKCFSKPKVMQKWLDLFRELMRE